MRPGQWRADCGVGQLCQRVVQLGLIGLDLGLVLIHQGPLLLELLPRHCQRLRQHFVALKVQDCSGQHRLILLQDRLLLIELRLQRARIDHGQRVVQFDGLPLFKQNLRDFPVDPTLNIDRVVCLDVANAGQKDRHVVLPNRRNLDLDRRTGLRRKLLRRRSPPCQPVFQNRRRTERDGSRLRKLPTDGQTGRSAKDNQDNRHQTPSREDGRFPLAGSESLRLLFGRHAPALQQQTSSRSST